jgi:hypothetical protein
VTLIDMLPDDVLLDIFDLCVHKASDADDDEPLMDPPTKKKIELWETLVHVCRRWRSVVFGSPRRLNLQLVCTPKTRVEDTLDIWPALPLVVMGRFPSIPRSAISIAALERSDRVKKIDLDAYNVTLSFETVLAAMQKPFPELTVLVLRLYFDKAAVLPDSFLGGSAPRLRRLQLEGIPFPSLPKLLLSATHLVNLKLRKIPHSGYMSPETMVTVLTTLTSLEQFKLQFISPRSRPGRTRRPPPPTRTILPVLESFSFQGAREYLDDLVACIDAPRLERLYITFFHQFVYDTPHLAQFISRIPSMEALEEAHFFFENTAAGVYLSTHQQTPRFVLLIVKILCDVVDLQFLSLEMVCTSCLPPLSKLEDLYIFENKNIYLLLDWQDDIDDALWLLLLRPFTAVKNLSLAEEIAPYIMPFLQELVGGRTTEVMPNLQNIFLEQSGIGQEGIVTLSAARQLFSHPISVSLWIREVVLDTLDFDDWL